MYEAASAIVNLPGCSAKELAPAVSGYQHPFAPAPHVHAQWELGPGLRVGGKKEKALQRPQCSVKKRIRDLVCVGARHYTRLSLKHYFWDRVL